MKYLLMIACCLMAGGLFFIAGLDIESDAFHSSNPLAHAAATATVQAARTQRQADELVLAVKATMVPAQVEAETTRLAANTGVALAEAKRAQAVQDALALSGTVMLVACALGGAILVLALSAIGSTAAARRAMLASSMLAIGSERATLMPPPLVITSDGYMIDTRTGERARLRDTAGVDALRLAATTHMAETAISAAASGPMLTEGRR